MRVLPRKKIYIFFLIATIILLAPFLIFKVYAQDGTGYAGLVLNPHKGHGGETIQVNIDLNTWVSINNDRATPNLYSKKTFTLVWDIGGWTNNEIAALPDVIMKTSQWERIGSATFDSNGHLTGTATIPNRNEIGDHLLYALNEDGILQGSTMDYWWGFYEILPETTVVTPLPTPIPTPILTSHPANCTLTVNWADDFIVYVQGHVVSGQQNNNSFSATYPWGTSVHLLGSYDGTSDQVEWEGWSIFDSTGRHAGLGPNDIDLVMNGDISAEPKLKNVGSGTGIPGFPVESILIGLLLALGLLYATKNKSKVSFPTLK
jgi:hypothetical protein